ncbi:C-type lectin 37Da-like [Drosophila teissieri]|uniref:C-type lectin 37Da-like n=1 Tax=Drosophila teissieri TaxID=7243 RepID=UPI001CBA5D10|nr:C-type lectin 37Da-like [Drosophila teissieri]
MLPKLTALSAFLAIISLSAAYQISTSVIDGVAAYLNTPTDPFVKIGDSYYFIESKRDINWYGAFEACRQMNADLVAFEDWKEQKLVSQYLDDKKDNKFYWTAGTDLAKQDYFVWFSTGQPVATDLWMKGEPNNFGGIEHCVELKSDGGRGLNDRSCTDTNGYICKAPQPKTVSFIVW